MGDEVSSRSTLSQIPSTNSRNVSIAGESTLSAVGSSIYNTSIDTAHNLEPALDVGNFPRTISRPSDARLRFADTKKNKFWVTIKNFLPRCSILIAAVVMISIGVARGGSAYGIYVEGESTVQLQGTNEFDITGFDESYGIAVKCGSKVDMAAGSTTKIRIDGDPVS
ncbi:uncharacterized protein LACBIDRAFT_295359 [Laccaria bicolor S238N-H82]|uniref:Predicted protein n=1 Tax=Laccaria bicolor (strain S238N-H82 / ATCC MYA-4686) TaxID=486041 RepID=B0DRB7_LACBS|nr:uncharacterized protein LACBIDRAFT_295359 [Laccaria bicolor S238N-H82]EDR02758.1 predicted protein [Laccaria bicolor S238N-H82]|eukprot:XP_001886468.1 predicted protein [Laccaria bicolor S238N-H82]